MINQDGFELLRLRAENKILRTELIQACEREAELYRAYQRVKAALARERALTAAETDDGR